MKRSRLVTYYVICSLPALFPTIFEALFSAQSLFHLGQGGQKPVSFNLKTGKGLAAPDPYEQESSESDSDDGKATQTNGPKKAP